MRALYIVTLRSVTVAVVLAVTITVAVQGHVMVWPTFG